MQNLKSFPRTPTLSSSLKASFATSTATQSKKGFLSFLRRGTPLPNLKTYYDLRIYRNASVGCLLHTLLVNTVTARKVFQSHGLRTYDIFSQTLGETITNSVFFCALADAYGVKSDLSSIKNNIAQYNDRNISVLVKYRTEPKYFSEYELDDNARRYIEIIEVAGGTSYKDNSVAINIATLCNQDVLTKLNRAQTWIDNLFEREFGKFHDKLSAQTIYEKMKQRYIECDESEAAEFFSLLLNREISSDLNSVEITRGEWLQNIHAYYLEAPEKNENKIQRQLNRLTDEELRSVEAFVSRVRSILDKAKSTNLSAVSYEIEQEEIAATSNSISQQLSTLYNQNRALLLKELKDSGNLAERTQLEIDFATSSGNPYGVKLVSNTALTSEAYEQAVKALLNRYQEGSQLVIKTSTVESIDRVKSLLESKGLNSRKSGVRFVQSEGAGDYLTRHLTRDGFGTIKELNYGDKDEIVRWMMTRNDQSSDNSITRRIENKLVINEFARRLRLV